jgi:hypothetical protein
MASVATVPMHEEVHERAKDERRIKEYAQDMGAVLGEQQHAGNDEEAQQNQSRRGGKKTTLLPMGGVVVQRHWCCTAVRRRSPYSLPAGDTRSGWSLLVRQGTW